MQDTALPAGQAYDSRGTLTTPASAVEVEEEIGRVEAAIEATNKTLTPSLWAAARTTPATTKIVMEVMRALADLHMQRDALERRAGLAG